MSDFILKNITHSYDDHIVVNDVSIQVASGEITCLLGPSGCGKSTVLRLAAGLETIGQGEVYIGKTNVTKTPTEKRGVGLVFQNPLLFPHLTVLENVLFGITSNMKKEKRLIALKHLKKVRMDNFLSCYPSQLSGGQQQRVSLARALAHSPKVMLLDEPFANLDSTLRKSIRDEALGLLKSTKIATLMVTHDPEEALRMADNIYVMQDGKIVQNGKPKKLYTKPKNSFIAGFFGELNRIEAKVDGKVVKTPLGDFAANNIDDGTLAEIAIRPECVLLEKRPSKNNIAATIENIRFLGLTSIIYLRTQDSNISLRARVLSDFSLSVGSGVYLKVEKELIFPVGI